MLVPDAYRRQIWNVMRQTPRHTYQILTKRPEQMARWTTLNSDITTPFLPNVWLGTSIENNRYAYRARVLAEIPAAVRFISAEPLLGLLPDLVLDGIDWLIVGGESGPRHRPIDATWVRYLRDTAETNGVAFFFKQWGGRTPKAGGRLLDGRTWEEFPRPRTPDTKVAASRSSEESREGTLGRIS